MTSFRRKRSAIFFAVLMIRFTQARYGISEHEKKERCKKKTSNAPIFPICMMSWDTNTLWCDQSRFLQIRQPDQHPAIDENVARKTEALYINNSCLLGIGKGELSEYHSIQHFNASQNFITRLIEATFSDNGKLLRIDLSHNLIAEIEGDSFEGLRNLLHLDLSDNEINDVNSWTFEHLTSLETLSLARNELAVLLPQSFMNLKALKSLDLSDNRIVAVQDPFRDLHNLQELVLDRNFFGKTLTTETFAGISKLQNLSLSFNEITVWPESYGQLLVDLRVLDLSSNFIAKFNHNHLAELKNLSHLSLGNNRLKILEGNQFSSNEKLKFLDLSKNYIEDIAQDAFAPLKQLETLLLEGNGLKTPNKRWFEKLSKEKTPHVTIGGTHWSCNCDIVEFKEFVDQLQNSDNNWNKTLASQLKITCSRPRYVEEEILDEYIPYDIKNRRECQDSASTEPKEPPPVTHPPTASTIAKPPLTLITTVFNISAVIIVLAAGGVIYCKVKHIQARIQDFGKVGVSRKRACLERARNFILTLCVKLRTKG